jgi:hypothetical protein
MMRKVEGMIQIARGVQKECSGRMQRVRVGEKKNIKTEILSIASLSI